jgi:hypothetical protein
MLIQAERSEAVIGLTIVDGDAEGMSLIVRRAQSAMRHQSAVIVPLPFFCSSVE